jgi:predicted HTH transcriptional regulator
LVKDVSSFANLKGGFILIGLRTKKDRNYLGDVVEGFSCIDKNSVDLDQYYNVINDWIYPKIEGLKN